MKARISVVSVVAVLGPTLHTNVLAETASGSATTWAAVGALGTVIAAIGTVGTLGVALYQLANARKRQDALEKQLLEASNALHKQAEASERNAALGAMSLPPNFLASEVTITMRERLNPDVSNDEVLVKVELAIALRSVAGPAYAVDVMIHDTFDYDPTEGGTKPNLTAWRIPIVGAFPLPPQRIVRYGRLSRRPLHLRPPEDPMSTSTYEYQGKVVEITYTDSALNRHSRLFLLRYPQDDYPPNPATFQLVPD